MVVLAHMLPDTKGTAGGAVWGQSHRELTGWLIFDTEGEELELDPTGQAGREKEAVESKSGPKVCRQGQ